MAARPVVIVAAAATLLLAACSSTVRSHPATPPTSTSAPAAAGATGAPTRVPRPTHTRTTAHRHRTASRPIPSPTLSPTPPPTAAPRAERLPLRLPTGSARQVVTVVAGAESDTQGTVRAWRKVPGGWRPVGPPLPAWLGSDGMTPHPNESLSAVPMGSFTLTHAFGHDPNPGTDLPYRQTTPADWWISQPGSYYNTEQHCAYGCPFTQGDPNEHLYYETPYYNYAAVIDYNTTNSPTGVRQGAGSAFFLHVTVGAPTQGCVAIDQTQLVRILRWLEPAEHPRILIGLAG